MAQVFKGDVGTKIRCDAGMDISAASSLKIRYAKPDGTKGLWDATLEGTRFAYYITQDGDLDQIGQWEVQIYATIGSWTGHGEKAVFEVYDTLE